MSRGTTATTAELAVLLAHLHQPLALTCTDDVRVMLSQLGLITGAQSHAKHRSDATPPWISPLRSNPNRTHTAVAGLVLLHPWLSAASRAMLAACEVEAQSPDAILLRRVLLAQVCASHDWQAWLDDPLVALLAGDDPQQTPPTFADWHLSHPATSEQASHLLRTFATQVPGLANHGDDLLRRYFIVRAGRLRPLEPSGWRVVLANGMLDMLLDRGGPPMGIVKLPWTPLLQLERTSSTVFPD
jgi:hypothetical protein